MESLLGKTLKNRYRVDEFVGRGGMADVYKVWDEERAVYLAMKVLRQDLAQDPIFLRRFQREAKALAGLQHPHIVRFYGLERDDLLAFLLMEYVDGISLQGEILRSEGKPLPMEHIQEVMQAVCSALHYAHHQGLVHCDIKPGNILIDKHGQIYLTDFGIARGMDAATSTMVGIGTPAYMAPELIKGEDPTPQTDIYALGIVLYEMLTGGERPFTGERATITGTTADKVRWEHLKMEPIPLSKFNSSVPLELEKIVMTCLEKSPHKRFGSILELFTKLQYALEKSQALYRQSGKIDSALLIDKNKKNEIKYEQRNVSLLNSSDRRIEQKIKQQSNQNQERTRKQKSTNIVIPLAVVGIALLIGITVLFAQKANSNMETLTTTSKTITDTKMLTATTVPQPVIASAEVAKEVYLNSRALFASPGQKTFMSGTYPMLFASGWEAIDGETLTQNLNYIDWKFYLNQIPVSQDNIVPYFDSNQDGNGKMNIMYVEDWPEGNYLVEIDLNIQETINDGWDEYEPQQMSDIYDISVTSGQNGTDFKDWPIVYHDNFVDDDGEWWTGSVDTALTGYEGEIRMENGYYLIEMQSGDDTVLDCYYPSITTVGDFYLSVKTGDALQPFTGSYILQFLDSYFLFISDDGEYSLYDAEEDIDLISLTSSPDINTNGNNASNEIAVLKIDDLVSIYINGVKQAEITDVEIKAGEFGIGAATWTFPSRFYFDEIQLRMP